MYKAALAVRRTLTTNDDDLTWHNEFGPEVLHFSRPGGWECIVNFGRRSVRLLDADILLTSESLEHPAVLTTDTTAWLLRPHSANSPGSR
jgi:alpha-glucosidase